MRVSTYLVGVSPTVTYDTTYDQSALLHIILAYFISPNRPTSSHDPLDSGHQTSPMRHRSLGPILSGNPL